ncbi:hypothetical protein N0V88_006789 [Collariella sp. IMI 366227]|nr:hypothetical protein N0V88_006789 [Collariella sp. IMI 366227]
MTTGADDSVHYEAFLVRCQDALDEIKAKDGKKLPILLDGNILTTDEELRQGLKRAQAQRIARYLPQSE